MMGMVEVRLINHSRQAVDLFSQFVRQAPAIRDVFKLTGDFDYLIKFAVSNLAQMSQLVTELASLQGSVSHLHTSVVLERVKENGIVFTEAGQVI